jgi:hypothetical protein
MRLKASAVIILLYTECCHVRFILSCVNTLPYMNMTRHTHTHTHMCMYKVVQI